MNVPRAVYSLRRRLVALLIGVILGPRIERQLRQSLQLGGGDWASLFHEPVAVVVYVCMVALVAVPLLLKLFHRKEPDMIHATAEDFEEEKAGS